MGLGEYHDGSKKFNDKALTTYRFVAFKHKGEIIYLADDNKVVTYKIMRFRQIVQQF